MVSEEINQRPGGNNQCRESLAPHRSGTLCPPPFSHKGEDSGHCLGHLDLRTVKGVSAREGPGEAKGHSRPGQLSLFSSPVSSRTSSRGSLRE